MSQDAGGVREVPGESTYRFGVSQFTTNPQSFEDDVTLYAGEGVEAIEVVEAKLDASRWPAQMALVKDRGLPICSVQPAVRTLFPSQSMPDPLDPADRATLFCGTIERLASHTPGAAYVTNTGIAPDGNVQQVTDTSIREYRRVAECAERHGVRVALEPLSPFLANIETAVWTITQARRIVESVNHPAFGYCLDVWNIWQNANLAAEIAACAGRVFIVHIGDWRTPRTFRDRVIPGTGDIPLPPILRAIRDTGYTGPYAVELFSDESLPDSLWRADPAQVLRDSRAGLDKAWRRSLLDTEA